MPVVLCREDGAAEFGAGAVFSFPIAGLLRMSGVGTRNGVARGGFVRSTVVPWAGADRSGAGSFDNIADATIDRFGHPSDRVHVGCSMSGDRGANQGEDARDRCDDTRSKRGPA